MGRGAFWPSRVVVVVAVVVVVVGAGIVGAAVDGGGFGGSRGWGWWRAEGAKGGKTSVADEGGTESETEWLFLWG